MGSGAWAKLGSANAPWVRFCASAFAVAVLLLQSAFAALPISIRNEADVAVENGRRHLEAAQREDGFWTMDGRTTVLPAFAFLGAGDESPPAPLAAAARAALARLARYKPPSVRGDAAVSSPFPPPSVRGDVAERFPKGTPPSVRGDVAERFPKGTPPSLRGDAAERQGGVSLAEDALILAATLSLHGPDAIGSGSSPRGLLTSARTRLLRLDPAAQTPSSAWLARCALDLIPGRHEQPADWAPLFSRRHCADSSATFPTCAAAPLGGSAIRDCAIAGYARIRHGAGADSPAAILAHLRWLHAHAGDLLGDATPEDLYFASVFLDAAPPALVTTAGIPADWRSRIAQRLIATARSDGHAGSVWSDPNASPSLRQTLYAVATLAALGE